MPVAPPVSAGEDGLYYCYRHKKTPTRVTCGRCDKPICDRCMVIGPAGVRCRECARNRVPLRLGGVFHDLTGSFGSILRPFGSNPWLFYIGAMIVMRVLFGCFRG